MFWKLQVAQSNKALNISNVDEWRRDNGMTNNECDDAANVQTMLCMPIVNANKDVIGVAQLINKARFLDFQASSELFNA